MRKPLTFPTTAQLSGRGWKLDALSSRGLKLLISADRDATNHVLGYAWALTRDGRTVHSGEAGVRGECIDKAYRVVFVEKQA